MNVKTCKGCKYRKKCNGRISRNSKYCKDLRFNHKVEDSVSAIFRKFRGITKEDMWNNNKESEEKKRKREKKEKKEKRGKKVNI